MRMRASAHTHTQLPKILILYWVKFTAMLGYGGPQAKGCTCLEVLGIWPGLPPSRQYPVTVPLHGRAGGSVSKSFKRAMIPCMRPHPCELISSTGSTS